VAVAIVGLIEVPNEGRDVEFGSGCTVTITLSSSLGQGLVRRLSKQSFKKSDASNRNHTLWAPLQDLQDFFNKCTMLITLILVDLAM